jgi:arsenate reductase
MQNPVTVLFVGRFDVARAPLAASLLPHLAAPGRFRALSAGTRPAAATERLALRLLAESGLRGPDGAPRDARAFAAPEGPALDVVVTLCDRAAGELGSVWSGAPLAAHWGLADPLGAPGGEAERMAALRRCLDALVPRLRALAALPFATADRLSLERGLAAIGAEEL